jgi:hypothetical protein
VDGAAVATIVLNRVCAAQRPIVMIGSVTEL